MNMLWFEKLIVRFFMSIDSVLFNFIATLYDLLIAISRTSILTQGDISSFVARIEIMLGIFMLFKVSFSLITYIVNPDDFSDSSKGFGKLIKNSVISLVMLVLVPYAFQLAFNLQAKILDDNVLAKLLLGERINGDNGATLIDTAGDQMAFYVMLPFFSPNYSVKDLAECVNMVDTDGSFNPSCEAALKDAGLDSPDLDNYTHGIENKSLGLTFRTDTAVSLTKEAKNEGDKADQHFVIDYQKPLSTITAVVVCLLLISFCIDVGVRSVKLAFLQLIYPIPVISYMDPKSGQDGMFTKWYKMCLSTFLSLFIRLLALYFGIYIIAKVSDLGVYDIINGSQITNGWVKIFIIVGVLMFVKQLPKILESLGFKIEGDGKFNLNPLKKLEEGAVGGKILKKPNEMLGKMGKGALFAAPHALQTGGKKLIGGIDAARNGKGFRQGWNRTHGKLYNSYHKKLDEWAPDSAEARKNERQARENIHQMDKKMNEGRKVYSDVKGNTDGLMKKFSQQYRDSYKAVNDAKSEMYAAQANKQAQLNRIEQQQQAGYISAAEAESMIANVNKSAGTAEKRFEVAKAKHDEMKKIYTKDAALEDAFDYYDKTASNVDKFVLLKSADNKPSADEFVQKYTKEEFDEISKRTGTSVYSASEKATIRGLYNKEN